MQRLTHETFVRGCKEIANWMTEKDFTALYGIPRGGQVVAVYLSHMSGVPVTATVGRCTLVVDDIADTGKTLLPYDEAGFSIATLYYCKDSLVVPAKWVYKKGGQFIQFPWETVRSAKVDYGRPGHKII